MEKVERLTGKTRVDVMIGFSSLLCSNTPEVEELHGLLWTLLQNRLSERGNPHPVQGFSPGTLVFPSRLAEHDRDCRGH